MTILTIQTNEPEAVVGLIYNDTLMGYEKWHAHRELSATIHKKIQKILSNQEKDWSDIDGIIMYKGPGSFTGLRIGFSVGNALALANGAAIVSNTGKNWVEQGIKRLKNGENEGVATPEYGAPANTTKPRK